MGRPTIRFMSLLCSQPAPKVRHNTSHNSSFTALMATLRSRLVGWMHQDSVIFIYSTSTMSFQYGLTISTLLITSLRMHHTVTGWIVGYSNLALDPWDPPQKFYSVQPATALASTSAFGNVLSFKTVVGESAQIICTQTESEGGLLPSSDAHPVTVPPIPQQGSALVVWWQTEPGADPYELNVFFQTENGNIIQDADANGPWVNDTVPAR